MHSIISFGLLGLYAIGSLGLPTEEQKPKPYKEPHHKHHHEHHNEHHKAKMCHKLHLAKFDEIKTHGGIIPRDIGVDELDEVPGSVLKNLPTGLPGKGGPGTGGLLPGSADVPRPYKDMVYVGFTVADVALLSLSLSEPHSKPNSIYFAGLDDKSHTIERANDVNHFDLSSVYFGCIGNTAEELNVPVPCSLTALGTKLDDSKVATTMHFMDGMTQKLFTFPKQFKDLKKVRFVLQSGLPSSVSAVSFDNFKYKTYRKC